VGEDEVYDMSDDEFDAWARTIENEMMEEVKQIYSPIVINEWLHPSNVGRMHDADMYAIITGPCGDTMELYLKVKENTIAKASFMTDGCGATIACGSMTTKMLTNLSVDDALKLNDVHLIKKLGGLPQENVHCATLAIRTLKKALEKCEKIYKKRRV
jgi:nitrogen fixation NifU-like protein